MKSFISDILAVVAGAVDGPRWYVAAVSIAAAIVGGTAFAAALAYRFAVGPTIVLPISGLVFLVGVISSLLVIRNAINRAVKEVYRL